jgi:HD-like signal output (HDOD) protein
MSTVWENISRNAKLVSLPDVYLRLKAVLDDPNSNLADVAEVVGNDPSMTARLLRIVNSAYFGLGSEIDTVSRAVGLLGTQEVHDLVLAASVAQSFEGMSNKIMDMRKFWQRSVVCAITGRELATLCNVLDGERLFVAGLLRDIGHLYIYQLAPEKAQQAIELAEVQGAPLYKAERALLGVDYARVGADLMHQWQLPQSLWEPTEYQVEPAKSQEYDLFTCLVHIAAHLTDGAEHGLGVEVALAGVSEHAWQVTGLTAEQCAGIGDRVEVQVAAVMRLIFPSLEASAA